MGLASSDAVIQQGGKMDRPQKPRSSKGLTSMSWRKKATDDMRKVAVEERATNLSTSLGGSKHQQTSVAFTAASAEDGAKPAEMQSLNKAA